MNRNALHRTITLPLAAILLALTLNAAAAQDSPPSDPIPTSTGAAALRPDDAAPLRPDDAAHAHAHAAADGDGDGDGDAAGVHSESDRPRPADAPCGDHEPLQQQRSAAHAVQRALLRRRRVEVL